MRELSIKGAAFRQLLDTYRAYRGEAFLRDVIARVPGPCGEALRTSSLLASEMVPLAWYRDLLKTSADVSEGGLVFAREMGRRSAERDIGSIHKMVFRILSVDTALKQIPRLMRLYFDGGKGAVESSSPGQVRLVFSELHGFDALVWQDFIGGIEAMMGAMGAQSARARIVEGGAGPDATVEVQYRM